MVKAKKITKAAMMMLLVVPAACGSLKTQPLHSGTPTTSAIGGMAAWLVDNPGVKDSFGVVQDDMNVILDMDRSVSDVRQACVGLEVHVTRLDDQLPSPNPGFDTAVRSAVEHGAAMARACRVALTYGDTDDFTAMAEEGQAFNAALADIADVLEAELQGGN